MSTQPPSATTPLSQLFDFRMSWGVVITVVGWIGLGLIFYANTKATLSEHARQFDRVFEQFKVEIIQREKLRDDFAEQLKRTADGISQLNNQVQSITTQNAVANARYDAILLALTRMQTELERRNREPNREPK